MQELLTLRTGFRVRALGMQNRYGFLKTRTGSKFLYFLFFSPGSLYLVMLFLREWNIVRYVLMKGQGVPKI